MNALQQILEHDAASPWTFLNGSFWLFLLVVLALDAALHRDRQRGLRHFWLLLASLLFYWKTSGWFFLILVFSSFSSLVHFCESLASCLVVSLRLKSWSWSPILERSRRGKAKTRRRQGEED